jgi:hypothetical protein
MKLSEVTRRWNADEKRAQAERNDMDCRPRIENTDALNQQIRNHRVEKSPDNVDRCRGETAPRRFCKGLWKDRPMMPLTKCGTAFTAKAPPKKYETRQSQFIRQSSFFQAAQ